MRDLPKIIYIADFFGEPVIGTYQIKSDNYLINNNFYPADFLIEKKFKFVEVKEEKIKELFS